jgi:perosamine synthetase
MHHGKYSELAIQLANVALTSDVYPETGQPWVAQFEENFAKFAGFKYAIAVNSGTSGIHAALMALNLGAGDEVISPGLTVIMDAFATIYTGATPVFSDVELGTWNLDPKSVEALITPNTRAIISVSWFGLPANLLELKRIAAKHNLALIDDSAETITLNGYELDDLSKPDFRIFSFESKKHVSTGGEGGMLVTDNPDLAKKARQSAGLGYKHLTEGKGRTSLASRVFQNPSYERFDAIGFNYRMTPVTAAIGIGQLANIKKFLDARRYVAANFENAIRGCSWMIPQASEQNGLPNSYYTYGVRYLGEDATGKSWTDFYDLFVEMGGHGFYSNCKNPYLEPYFFGKRLGSQELRLGLCPVAEKLQSQIMAFKTNYLDPSIAYDQSQILSNLISRLGR